MKAPPKALEVLVLSAGGRAPDLDMLRGPGVEVRVASGPDQALALLCRHPDLVMVDLVRGPALDPRVVNALNRAPRPRVVVLHEGRIDTHLDQVEHLVVDGFCRLERGASSPR